MIDLSMMPRYIIVEIKILREYKVAIKSSKYQTYMLLANTYYLCETEKTKEPLIRVNKYDTHENAMKAVEELDRNLAEVLGTREK